MKTPVILVVLLGLALGGGSVLVAQKRRAVELPPQASLPVGAQSLLFAVPFALERPYVFEWRRERPSVRSGWLLVIEVEERFCEPRQELEPVLYVGAQTAERVNFGRGSGRIVAIVPAPLGPDGEPALDLARVPIFFGLPDLPERVDAATARRELASARRAGCEPFSRAVVGVARARGGARLAFRERTDLRRYAARAIEVWAPAERELAESMLVPLVR